MCDLYHTSFLYLIRKINERVYYSSIIYILLATDVLFLILLNISDLNNILYTRTKLQVLAIVYTINDDKLCASICEFKHNNIK